MTDSNAPAGGEPLQFDNVEGASDMTCSNCGKPITTTYYDVNGNHVCPVCRGKLMASKPATGWGAFIKASVFGFGACLVGAVIYFAVAALFNLELALVAILIGWMVGVAMRAGAGGNGGRKYQVMAVALVYFSVGLAYASLVIKSAADDKKTSTTAAAPTADSVASADSADADSASAGGSNSGGDAKPSSAAVAGAVGVGLVAVVVMVFTLPVIIVIGSLPGGILSALIIGFGMQQAWRMTAGEELAALAITGPYRIKPPEAPAT